MIFKLVATVVGIFGGLGGIVLLVKFIRKKKRDRNSQ